MSFIMIPIHHHDRCCMMMTPVLLLLLLLQSLAPRGKLVLAVGLGSLLLVPAFKTITGLPPYMGMLAGLGFLWCFID
jgi:hypothetical protein